MDHSKVLLGFGMILFLWFKEEFFSDNTVDTYNNTYYNLPITRVITRVFKYRKWRRWNLWRNILIIRI